jgi:GNAT superfamily N-acetyltransferase
MSRKDLEWIYREYEPGDAEGYLRVHDAAFPAMEKDFWREFSQGPVTAAVAELNGEVVGAVPFHLRRFQVAPGVTISVAVEFSVCVRADLRGQGVGSRLMAEAREFLAGRCLAMMVYRGGEQTPGYRFYAANGHHDLLYVRPWTHAGAAIGGQASETEVTEIAWAEFLDREAEFLEVFHRAYAGYGGFPHRTSGYYGPAVCTSEYNELPVALRVLTCDGGYAIVGAEQDTSRLQLMELATTDGALAPALALLRRFLALAGQEARQAVAEQPDSSPYRPLLEALGFRQTPRSESSTMIMAHVLDPEGLARAVWCTDEATAALDVRAWTPERACQLHAATGAERRTLLLEMKEHVLTRLLFRRLDLEAAIADGVVTVIGGDRWAVTALARALPPVPWTYHYLDYI